MYKIRFEPPNAIQNYAKKRSLDDIPEESSPPTKTHSLLSVHEINQIYNKILKNHRLENFSLPSLLIKHLTPDDWKAVHALFHTRFGEGALQLHQEDSFRFSLKIPSFPKDFFHEILLDTPQLDILTREIQEYIDQAYAHKQNQVSFRLGKTAAKLTRFLPKMQFSFLKGPIKLEETNLGAKLHIEVE